MDPLSSEFGPRQQTAKAQKPLLERRARAGLPECRRVGRRRRVGLRNANARPSRIRPKSFVFVFDSVESGSIYNIRSRKLAIASPASSFFRRINSCPSAAACVLPERASPSIRSVGVFSPPCRAWMWGEPNSQTRLSLSRALIWSRKISGLPPPSLRSIFFFFVALFLRA